MDIPETLDAGPVMLQRWTLERADDLDRAINESLTELIPFMPWATPDHDPEATTLFIVRSHEEWDTGENFNYAMLVPAGDVVGGCGLMTRLGPGLYEIGYWVHSAYAGKGYATAAVLALTRAGLAQPGIDGVEIRHDADNPASGRVAAKAGFQEMGRIDAEKNAPGESGTMVVWAYSALQQT